MYIGLPDCITRWFAGRAAVYAAQKGPTTNWPLQRYNEQPLTPHCMGNAGVTLSVVVSLLSLTALQGELGPNWQPLVLAGVSVTLASWYMADRAYTLAVWVSGPPESTHDSKGRAELSHYV